MSATLGLAVTAALVCGVAGLLLILAVLPAMELCGVIRRLAKGDYRPVMLNGSPLFFCDTAVNLRQIAEMLERQKTLLAEEEFSLSMILESMTEGVVITGADLKIRLVNKAASSMFHLQGTQEGLLLHVTPVAVIPLFQFLETLAQSIRKARLIFGSSCNLP